MQAYSWNCICNLDGRDANPFELVKCYHCGCEAHSNCHELYSPETKKNFLCLRCRNEFNNPYFDYLYTLTKPICFLSGESINQEITFNLPPQEVAAVRNTKDHSVIAVLSKVIYENPKYIEMPDITDISISVFLNHQPLTRYPRKEIVLDPFIREGKNTLQIASHKLPSKCVLAIYYGKKVDIKEIAKRILKLETQQSFEEAKANFESIRFREFEVLAAFPVRDPITNKIMNFAARGSKCKHLQCFDLINFLKFYQGPTEKYWQCFWCKNIIPWRDIMVDQFLYTVLKEIREKYKSEIDEIDNICFDEEGNWKLQKDYSKEWEENFAANREKRLKEKKDRMEIEKENLDKNGQMQEEPIRAFSKSSLSVEECVESYNVLVNQLSHMPDTRQNHELVAAKMKELNSFKNLAANKVFEFFYSTKMYLGWSLAGIFDNRDDKILFYKLEELADLAYKAKFDSTIPIIFAWAKSYDDLIVITLSIMTKNKKEAPNMGLAIELLLCYCWFMETRKISLEGLIKQNMYQLFGKLLHHFGNKLQWGVQEYATLMVLFKKYMPDIHVPSTIPKKFCEESQRIFSRQADFISNMVKSFTMNELISFLEMVYKPPVDEIPPEEDKILKYVFYYFMEIFKRHHPSITNQEIEKCFKKWDKNNKASKVLESEGISAGTITNHLQFN